MCTELHVLSVQVYKVFPRSLLVGEMTRSGELDLAWGGRRKVAFTRSYRVSPRNAMPEGCKTDVDWERAPHLANGIVDGHLERA